MIRLILLLTFTFLAGCQNQNTTSHTDHVGKMTTHKSTRSSTVHTYNGSRTKSIKTTANDGPPPGPIPKKFNRVKPAKEPISRYGNPGAYRVNGHTYEVLTTAKGYKERGFASWYGTKFHSKRTSSGENYDLYALTAAHKTLPIPCYAKVTNLSNGRHVVVKITDRGPFHQGRIIDLSYGAAAKLGLLPKGTAPVEVEALATTNHTARYYLQAGAFSTTKLAQNLRSQISKLTTSHVFIERYKQFYVVRVGPIANKRTSDTLKSILEHRGIKGAVSMLQ